MNYIIALNFYTEPNRKGNCSRYYYVSKIGNKLKLGGIARARRYHSEKSANSMAEKLEMCYPNAEIKVMEWI